MKLFLAANLVNFENWGANGQFRILLSQQGGELEKLIRKLGPSIDKARPFYDAKGGADELHKKCLEAAAQFHRATDIHRAARETVTSVENRYEKDVNFDSTWQEVLNHATIQVMEAEKKKSDSERCHRALAERFYEAEKKVYELRKLLEKDILKSKPYFDMKNRLNAALSEVKTRTVKLQSSISGAKRAYSLALSNLEMISEEIHRKRTPGVGAEADERSISGASSSAD
ncbi:SH3 domain-binding protein 5 [Orchesella cincta]|uniref:SH3 domain-binding protein 5 n=1 Tax=Orchesella cincta TaxID=48709 RepID=A0A1D2MPF2_ORCCI|nr:SH3 domain-binding protein 5 [Orchesella cincta]